MVQVQIDLSEDVDKKLKIWMAFNDVRSKSAAIDILLEQYFILRPPKMKSGDDYDSLQ